MSSHFDSWQRPGDVPVPPKTAVVKPRSAAAWRIAMGAAVAVVAGGFGPWFTGTTVFLGTVSFPGINPTIGYDGWAMAPIVGGVVAAMLLIGHGFGPGYGLDPIGRLFSAMAGTIFFGIAAVGVYVANRIVASGPAEHEFLISVNVGWGLWLCLLSGTIGAVAAFACARGPEDTRG